MTLELSLDHAYPGFSLQLELTLAAPGITALFGPSGCGKSTLLRLLAGIEPARQGRILCDGRCWQDSARGLFLPAHAREIGMVFQDARLFPHLDVRANLAFAARYPRHGLRLQADWLIEQLQLTPLLTQRPATLSGGQRQRVALARALLSRPRLLLLDEPLSALDRHSRQIIMQLLEQLQRRRRLPMLYVTHAVDEVLRLAEQLVCLQQGRVVAQGDPTQIFGQQGHLPALGERALLRGEVVEQDARDRMSAVRCDPALPPIWIAGSEHPLGSRVTLSLHADDIALSLQPLTGTSLQNQLPVELSEILADDGDQVLLRVRFGRCLLPVRISHRALHRLQLQPGQPLWALIKSVAVEH